MFTKQRDEINIQLKEQSATEADLDILLDLEQKIFTRSFDNQFTRKQFADYLKRCDIRIIYHDEKPIGYYFYKDLNNEEAELVGAGFLPEYQAMGLGQYFLQQIIAKLAYKKRMKLVTHPKNIHAIKLYKKNGFRIVDRLDNYYGDGQPRILMYREQNTQ